MINLKLVPTKNLRFVRFVAGVSLNFYSAAVYEAGNCGKAYIVLEKGFRQIPRMNKVFKDLSALEIWLETLPGKGVNKLNSVLKAVSKEAGPDYD